MALIKGLSSESGLTVAAAYWRITFLSVAVKVKTVNLIVSPYNSQTDREDGKPPISGEETTVVISGDLFDSYFNPLPANTNHFGQAYAYLKTTDQFSGAEDA